LFKKYYKEANDDIQTNRALIDKIFEEAEKPVVVNKRARIYRFGMAAAAVLVIGVSVFSLSLFERENAENGNKPGMLAQSLKEDVGEQKIQSDVTEKPKDKVPSDEYIDNSGIQTEKSGSDKNLDESNQPTIDKIETIDSGSGDSSDGQNDIVLAMETEEQQGFAIPENPNTRSVEEPLTENIDQTEENSALELSMDELSPVSEDEANVIQNMLTMNFGVCDEENGNIYSFELVGKTDEVYLGRWKWLVDDHMSLLTEFVITADMSAMYECSYGQDGTVSWMTEKNLLFE